MFEVIVINDGSTDDTPRVLQEWQEKGVLNLRVFHQENRGAGSARNQGIRVASGELLVFLGDDMLPTPGCLEAHFRFHIHNPELTCVALGRVEWSPTIPVTPFMHWLTQSGVQFKFHDLKKGQTTDFRRFYTANISLKRTFLGADLFDERFHGWGFEDTELGYRLQERGMKLVYAPDILVHHYHPMTDQGFFDRMRSGGRNAVLFEKLHPTVRLIPRGVKRLLQLIYINLCPWTYYAKAKKGFFAGVKDGLAC